MIEQGDDEMHTTSGLLASTGMVIFSGEGSVTTTEIDYRMGHLAGQAARERLAGPREGVRQAVGHALIALGRAIHGLEPERAEVAARQPLAAQAANTATGPC